jgi:uncharacterized membrane protein
MTLWHFAHILGFVLWLGGGLASMMIGIRSRREDRAGWPLVARLQLMLHRILISPGILLAVVSGGYLSAAAAREGAPSSWLMLMQVAGVVAALLVLFVSMPTVTRLARMSPTGETATLFDALRRRQGMAGMIAGNLAMLALIGGVFHKY